MLDERETQFAKFADALWQDIVLESEFTSFEHELNRTMPPADAARKIIAEHLYYFARHVCKIIESEERDSKFTIDTMMKVIPDFSEDREGKTLS